jgi:hypothetical protein
MKNEKNSCLANFFFVDLYHDIGDYNIKEIKMRKFCELTAKTKHGKNRIHQHGSLWEIVGDGVFRGQEAWSLKSLHPTFDRKRGVHDGRWVLKSNDSNFSVDLGPDVGDDRV